MIQSKTPMSSLVSASKMGWLQSHIEEDRVTNRFRIVESRIYKEGVSPKDWGLDVISERRETAVRKKGSLKHQYRTKTNL